MSDLTHLLGKYVQLRTAQAHQHAEGEVVGVYTEPTVIVQTPDQGRVTWMAHLVHETERPTPAAICAEQGHNIQSRIVRSAAGIIAQPVGCIRCGLRFVPQDTP